MKQLYMKDHPSSTTQVLRVHATYAGWTTPAFTVLIRELVAHDRATAEVKYHTLAGSWMAAVHRDPIVQDRYRLVLFPRGKPTRDYGLHFRDIQAADRALKALIRLHLGTHLIFNRPPTGWP